MAMREKYAVEEVAKSIDRTTTEIDQIETEGWLKLGSYDPPAKPSPVDAVQTSPWGRRNVRMEEGGWVFL